MFKKTYLFLLLLIFTVGFKTGVLAQDDVALFNEAKKLSYKGEWDKAVRQFDHYIRKFPEGKYTDDAYFWAGYCLEQIPGEEENAFVRYEKLMEQFPQSQWIDDAVIHQIFIAEKIFFKPDKKFENFLVDLLENDSEVIKYQAALSLGRLKDRRALPVLREIQDISEDENMKKEARTLESLINSQIIAAQIDRTKEKEYGAVKAGEKKGDIKRDFGSKRTGINTPTGVTIADRTSDLLGPSKRMDLYKKMMKIDNSYSQEDIYDYGLFLITSIEEFVPYITLTTEYDKQEWSRKYWIENDPTPTTDENEAEKEFKRRIKYARENYGKSGAFYRSDFLKEKYLSRNYTPAPWDSRGELIVKFGIPDYTFPLEHQVEWWIYESFDVDFKVKCFQTNIFFDAIMSGSRYGGRFGWGYIYANYIEKNNMWFLFDYGMDPLEELTIDVFMPEISTGVTKDVTINFSIPFGQLRSKFKSEKRELFYRYVIFNEDNKKAAYGENIVDLTPYIPIEKRDKKELFTESIPAKLAEGIFKIALRIEDKKNSKLVIQKKTFEVN